MRALAEFCFRRRRYVVAGWVVFLAAIFALSLRFQGEFKTDFKLPGSESQHAIDLMEERGVDQRAGFYGQAVFHAEGGVDDPAVKTAMEDFFAAIVRDVSDVEVVSPFDPQNGHMVSDDRTIAYAEINFADRSAEQYGDDADTIKALRKEITVPGLQVELGGFLFASQPSFSSEFVGIAAAVIILLIAFGSLLAMGLPIMTALFGVGCGSAVIGLMTRVLDIPEFSTAIAAMIGIGVGIDYALLIVTRFRQALHDGVEPHEAAVLSLDTSGRAVLFAGITVVIALLGMFLMNLEFMRSIAMAAISAVFMTMLASLTLLPALLGFAGRNIDRFGLPHRKAAEGGSGRSFWYRWSRVIQNNPWPAFVGSAVLLIALATPVLFLRLGFGDAGNMPATDTTRRAYDLLARGFGPGFNAPILVVGDTSGGADDHEAFESLRSAVAADAGVASVTQVMSFSDDTLQMFNVYLTTAPQDQATTDAVHRIRHEIVPGAIAGDTPMVLLTGDPPFNVDFADYIAGRLPFFIGAVLLLSFLLLMLVFHSIVVAAKAVVMNMLSIAAAFGLMVIVFQWGIGDSLLGLGREGPVDAWVPMMLFAIVFGLSMDYEVFLLTRIREEYDRTRDNAQAVADGLAATGRVISAAAAIMICVFGAFVLGEAREMKLMGFGLASAIFIDATVVRLILVPAVMELMGDWNWYLPPWLRWLPVVRVDAEMAPAPRGQIQPAPGGGD